MKNYLILSMLLPIVACSFSSKNFQGFEDGDIIFQTSKSAQSKMIATVTNSELTHCGIIFYKKGEPFVFEAVDPVKVTPLKKWIDRGVDGKYKVVRADRKISKKEKAIMQKYAMAQLGKRYDIKFQWSNNKMYCSELVWKVYKSAGYNLCDTKKFSDYDLTSKSAKLAIKKRYNGSFNMNETVVTPADLYASNVASVVYSNY